MRIVRVALATMLATLLVATVVDAVAQNPPSQDSGHIRYEFANRSGWGSKVTPHSAQSWTIFDRELATPASAASIDVVVTVSLDYGVSRGDYAELGVSYKPAGDPNAELRPLRPRGLGKLSVARWGNPTSTTVTWIARDLEASGGSYQFDIGVIARDNNDDGRAKATGTNVAIVIDMLPSEAP